MKSRLLVSLLVIALAAALIGGATMAWFTDSDDAAPVTFTAGTLLIDLDNNFEAVTGADVENLNPGDTFSWEIEVENVGTKNFNWGIYVCWQDIIGQLNDSLTDDMRAMLVAKGYGDAGLSEVLYFTVTTAGDAPSETIVVQGNLPDEGPIGSYMDPLAPGGKATFLISAHLPGELTDNAFQGSKLQLAFGVKAWQTTNNAPAPDLSDVECPFADDNDDNDDGTV